jgi:hypothetical protein
MARSIELDEQEKEGAALAILAIKGHMTYMGMQTKTSADQDNRKNYWVAETMKFEQADGNEVLLERISIDPVAMPELNDNRTDGFVFVRKGKLIILVGVSRGDKIYNSASRISGIAKKERMGAIVLFVLSVPLIFVFFIGFVGLYVAYLINRIATLGLEAGRITDAQLRQLLA